MNVVKKFDADDFTWDSPKEGFTNYVDYINSGKGEYSRFYHKDATTAQTCNRGINIGSTYADLEAAYGYCKDYKKTVSSLDEFSDNFDNSKYPSYKVVLTYHDNDHNKDFYIQFYFDRTDTVVLIGWSYK